MVEKKSSTIAAQRSGGKEIDDLLNGSVGAMVGGFELADRLVMGVRAVVKAAVGERAAEPFVKEQEEQGDVNPFWGETVGVAGSVTLQQPVGFELAQVVAELVQPVGAVGEVEGGEDGVVDVEVSGGGRGVNNTNPPRYFDFPTTQQCSGAAPSRHLPPRWRSKCKYYSLLLHRTQRPAPSPRRLSSGRHAGRVALCMRTAAMPKSAPSRCTEIECP